MQSRRYGHGLRVMLAWCLLLLACCAPTCAADVVLTDEEATALKASLMRADEQLQTAQSELERSEKKLQTAEEKLQKAEKESEKLEQELLEQEERLRQLSTSWTHQKKEARLGKIKAFCFGALVGVAGGLAKGYYLTR